VDCGSGRKKNCLFSSFLLMSIQWICIMVVFAAANASSDVLFEGTRARFKSDSVGVPGVGNKQKDTSATSALRAYYAELEARPWLVKFAEKKNAVFVAALMRHETSSAAKAFGFHKNAELDSAMQSRWLPGWLVRRSFGEKYATDKRNSAENQDRPKAWKQIMDYFELIKATNKYQKELKVVVSPVLRALQTLRLTFLKSGALFEKYSVRVEAMLREATYDIKYKRLGATSGYPGSKSETRDLICKEFAGFNKHSSPIVLSYETLSPPQSTIGSDKLLNGGKRCTKSVAGITIIDNDFRAPAATKTTMGAPAATKTTMGAPAAPKTAATKMVASVGDDMGKARDTFERKYGYKFTGTNEIGLETERQHDLRVKYMASLVQRPEQEGTMYMGHGRMSMDIMNELYETAKRNIRSITSGPKDQQKAAQTVKDEFGSCCKGSSKWSFKDSDTLKSMLEKFEKCKIEHLGMGQSYVQLKFSEAVPTKEAASAAAISTKEPLWKRQWIVVDRVGNRVTF